MRTRFLTLALIAPALAACETSMRLAPMNNPFGSSDRLSPPPAVEQPRIEAAPAPRVEAAPLPPPVQSQALPPPPGASADPQSGLSGVTPGGPGAPATPVPQQQASAPPPPAAPAADAGPPTRSSVTGNWTARESSGGACKVTLSSVSKLDLYGASTSGCQSKDLQKVTAWELRGDDVFLYEPGGTVAARLKARGGQISGTLSKSGAPVTLSK